MMESPEDIVSNLDVSAYHDSLLEYPNEPPYNPHIRYPEYPIGETGRRSNPVYDAVRNALRLLKMDQDGYGTPEWNPFKGIVGSGDTVVIKPNFVLSNHRSGGDLFSIITHPSVIRAVVDYVYIAMAGKGKIIIADAPQMDCDFRELLERTQLLSIKDLYERRLGFCVEICDLRDFWLDTKGMSKGAYSKNRHRLSGDPMGGIAVNLRKESLFYGVENFKRFYGADYDRDETISHHHGDVQEYLISKTVLTADVVISVPKLKVHKKVGVTLNSKGLVGTCINKNYLIHHTLGTPSKGGDQFAENVLGVRQAATVRFQRWAYDNLLARKSVFRELLYRMCVRLGNRFLRPLGFGISGSILDAGNWHGNDSAWRMVGDLLKISMYADKEGRLHSEPVRRMFSVVDGVIGGEGDGPLAPGSKRCGLIVAGQNPCAVDLVCTRLMGFDSKKIRMLRYVLDHPELFKVSLAEIKTSSNVDFGDMFDEHNRSSYFAFVPHPGWQGFIEV